MFCVALAGNIASGKSTVAAEFANYGVNIIKADQIAKDLAAKGQPAFLQIVDHFGESVLTTTGELNRRQLRQIIVDNSEERQWLEKLLHPLIREQIKQEVEKTKSPYCLIEIPLLFDRSQYPWLNRVLLVIAEPEQQIARLMARDNSSREQALAIIATQADEQQHREIADDILINSGTIDHLRKEVAILHNDYLRLA